MREETITHKIYPFDELSDEAQEKAIEKLADINVNFEWWGFVYEDATIIGLKITEFELDRGSYCRGDWTEYPEDAARLILANHGESCETYKDADTFLTELAAKQVLFEADKDYNPDYQEFDESDDYQEVGGEFCQTILEDYRVMLQKEYEYQTSEEAIIETIKANEYEFTADGELH